MKKIQLILTVFVLTACVGIPEGVAPVRNFDLNRYLGKWYEIARLDHSFERGLEHVTAEYTLRQDGGVTVLNKGYSPDTKQWKTAMGKAYFVDHANEGHLKVSFFGPFYGSYVVFELDENNYEYAFVSGPNKSYLWLLARTPNLQQEIIEKFKTKSKDLGFDTSKLIFVNHDKSL